jgi:hypothetical protein
MVTTKPQGSAFERASQLGAWSSVVVLTLQIASFCVGTPQAVACLGAGEGEMISDRSIAEMRTFLNSPATRALRKWGGDFNLDLWMMEAW